MQTVCAPAAALVGVPHRGTHAGRLKTASPNFSAAKSCPPQGIPREMRPHRAKDSPLKASPPPRPKAPSGHSYM